ncbi:MAG: hypothetical protein SGPRY_011433 [Prymnesium sp.]
MEKYLWFLRTPSSCFPCFRVARCGKTETQGIEPSTNADGRISEESLLIEDSHQAALELCFLGKANRLPGQEPASDADLEQCCSYASSESTASTAPPTLSGTNEPSTSHPEGAVVDASPLPQPTHFQAASSRDGSLPSPPLSHPQTELTVNAESKSSDSPPALDEDNLCSDAQEASSAHTRPVLSSEATIEDDLQAEQPQCWGALLTNDHSNCTPGYRRGSKHQKNKFCNACRLGIKLPSERVVALLDEQHQDFANSWAGGVWATSPEGFGYRVINHTAFCHGPRLLIFESATRPPGRWLPVPNLWLHDGFVHVFVSKGTLVPIKAKPEWYGSSDPAAQERALKRRKQSQVELAGAPVATSVSPASSAGSLNQLDGCTPWSIQLPVPLPTRANNGLPPNRQPAGGRCENLGQVNTFPTPTSPAGSTYTRGQLPIDLNTPSMALISQRGPPSRAVNLSETSLPHRGNCMPILCQMTTRGNTYATEMSDSYLVPRMDAVDSLTANESALALGAYQVQPFPIASSLHATSAYRNLLEAQQMQVPFQTLTPVQLQSLIPQQPQSNQHVQQLHDAHQQQNIEIQLHRQRMHLQAQLQHKQQQVEQLAEQAQRLAMQRALLESQQAGSMSRLDDQFATCMPVFGKASAATAHMMAHSLPVGAVMQR